MEFENRIDLTAAQQALANIKAELRKVIVGQEEFIDQFLVALLSNGHVLIEGVPGVAKTLTAKLMAKTFSVDFSRIQFTPDLMPSDVTGTSIFNSVSNDFEFKKGPVFSNIVLIDEINRAPAKTQAALFEVMEERQITADGTTYQLEAPFLVFATQNPIEQEGTYRLPEAQLDRFLFKIELGYPTLEEEKQILSIFDKQTDSKAFDTVKPVVTQQELLALQSVVNSIHIEENLRDYIAEVVHKTRSNRMLYLGASPRASLAILQSSKAMAVMNGRDFVTPEDIQLVTAPVLRHRILLTAEKEMEGATPTDVISQIVKGVEIPR